MSDHASSTATHREILARVRDYFEDKLDRYGTTPKGVDWNSVEAQEIRFAQLLKVIVRPGPFSINDYGCGYGQLVDFLQARGHSFQYHGFDISPKMIDEAKKRYSQNPTCRFTARASDLELADYTVASGIFNVKLEYPDATWEDYVFQKLDQLDQLSRRGFAFNVLTNYADPDRRRADLYYADPGQMFHHCVRRFARHVALLHDYGLFCFTVLVKKEASI